MKFIIFFLLFSAVHAMMEYTPETSQAILFHKKKKHVMLFVPHNASIKEYVELEQQHPECLFVTTKLHRRNKQILDYFFITLPALHAQNSIACIDHRKKAIEINMNHNTTLDVVVPSFCS